MNTPKMILIERLLSKEETPNHNICAIPPRLLRLNHHLGRALRYVSIGIVIAFLAVLSSPASGANPAEELAKMGRNSQHLDPKGNSWEAIQESIEQFGHPDFIFR